MEENMNKTVIITGANSGIGKAATVKFAEEGYTVIMACRNMEKSTAVQKSINDMIRNNYVDLMELDISSFDSILRFCSMFKEKYKRLDILVHNAAYFNHGETDYRLSPDNIELTFATNTVGPFLMTHLLIDTLKKSDDARILNACTTNIRHYFDPKRKIDFDNLLGEYKDTRPYSVYKMYGDSKIALLMLTFKLADKLKDEGMKVNAIQISGAKMSKDTIKKFKSVWKIAAMIQNTYFPRPEEVAESYYQICTSAEFSDTTGRLINHKNELVNSTHYAEGLIQDIKQFMDKGVYPKYADDMDNIEKVWNFCVKTTDRVYKVIS